MTMLLHRRLHHASAIPAGAVVAFEGSLAEIAALDDWAFLTLPLAANPLAIITLALDKASATPPS